MIISKTFDKFKSPHLRLHAFSHKFSRIFLDLQRLLTSKKVLI